MLAISGKDEKAPPVDVFRPSDLVNNEASKGAGLEGAPILLESVVLVPPSTPVSLNFLTYSGSPPTQSTCTSFRFLSSLPDAPTAPNASSTFLNKSTAVANLGAEFGLSFGGFNLNLINDESIGPNWPNKLLRAVSVDRSGRLATLYLMAIGISSGTVLIH